MASVSETTIGTEESVTYSVEIQGAASSAIRAPNAPDAVGLSLVRTVPSTQSSVSIVNGVMEQSFAYRWVYRPEGQGSARIASTTVTVSGQAYRTEPIDVTIVPQSQRPARAPQTGRSLDPFAPLFRSPFDNPEPEPLSAPGETDLFIRAVPSSRSVVQNEQVTIEYQLFFREGIQLRQSRLTDSWDAEGFWREELEVETRPIPQVVVENGLRYNKIILKRAAVFPTRTGRLVVDSLRIESEAVLPGRSGDPFRQLFSLQNRFQPVDLASPSVEIESRPFPEGAPSSFLGAVGDFDFDVTVDRTNVDVGSSVQVIARVSGSGNLATLAAPVFTPPPAFELYDPQVRTSLTRSGARLRGSKTFTYVLVPRANGTFELPGIAFSHFNPTSGTYVSERSDPISVLVTGAPTTPAAIVATTNGLPVDDVAPRFDDVGRLVPIARPRVHTLVWPYAALFAPLVLLGLARVYQSRRIRLAVDVGYARHRRAHPLARKHLTEAKNLLDGGRTAPFFSEVERAVLGFVGDRLNIPEKGKTRRELDATMRRAGMEEGLRSRLQALLAVCDQGRFAPGGVEHVDLMRAYDEAATLIVLMDTALNGRA